MSSDVAELILERFVERRDVKAVQSSDGSKYSPDRCAACWELYRQDPTSICPHRPLDHDAVLRHLAGRQTYGHYLIDPLTNTCRVFAFDVDLSDQWQNGAGGELADPRAIWADDSADREYFVIQLNQIARALASRTENLSGGDIRTAISYSGSKGVHVYGFLDPGTPADVAREVATTVLMSFKGQFVPRKGKSFWAADAAHPLYEIEVYPKQTEISVVHESGCPNVVSRIVRRGGMLLGDPKEYGPTLSSQAAHEIGDDRRGCGEEGTRSGGSGKNLRPISGADSDQASLGMGGSEANRTHSSVDSTSTSHGGTSERQDSRGSESPTMGTTSGRQDSGSPDCLAGCRVVGFGNLMRLPLGVHRKSGKKGRFLHRDTDPTKFVGLEPEKALA